MSSLRKILSSRANGAKSGGPATPEGRSRSSTNATRHGLLADCIVLRNESRQSFEDLLAQHIERLAPGDGVEFGMIEEMAAAYWRMRRAWAIEARLFDDSVDKLDSPDELARITQAFSDLAASPQLALLHRYETRLHLCYQRGLHNLLLLRTAYQTNPVPISDTSVPSVSPG